MPVEYRVLGPLEVTVDGRPGATRAAEATRDARPSRLSPEHARPGIAPRRRPVGGRTHRARAGEPRAGLRLGSSQGTRQGGDRDAGAPVTSSASRWEPSISSGSRSSRATEAARSSAATPDEASTVLRAALALWRGPALADLADEPLLRPGRGRLEELRLLALERRIEADLALGRHADVVGELERLVGRPPATGTDARPSDDGALPLRAARPRRSRPSAAARSTLVGELGIEPSAWLTELEQRDAPTRPGARAWPGAPRLSRGRALHPRRRRSHRRTPRPSRRSPDR